MELKVICNCGQKFKFDVEPVNGLMPFTVNCPVCGLDGTGAANTLLAQARSLPPPLLDRELAQRARRQLWINKHDPIPGSPSRSGRWCLAFPPARFGPVRRSPDCNPGIPCHPTGL